MLETAEQCLEQTLRRSRLHGACEAKRQCGEDDTARATDRIAVGNSQAGLPTPGTDFRGAVSDNAGLQKRLQGAADPQPRPDRLEDQEGSPEW